MAENSKIEWTDHTFNPWIGCTKVSAGCQHCYAEQLMDLRYGKVEWGPSGTRTRTSEANWRLPLKWDRQAKEAGVRHRVFCASLADVFEDRLELVEWRKELLSLIDQTQNLDWLLLTKRPENFKRMYWERSVCSCGEPASHNGGANWKCKRCGEYRNRWYRENVWVGVSVEDQKAAEERIPYLLSIDAEVRFLSIEPLLGPIDLESYLRCQSCGYTRDDCCQHGDHHLCKRQPFAAIDWVIVGGESGPGARPMHPDWVRSIRDQCVGAGVPFFFKQWGEWREPVACERHDTSKGNGQSKPAFIISTDGNPHCFRETAGDGGKVMLKVGKAKAGRLLDGREWNEMPGCRGE